MYYDVNDKLKGVNEPPAVPLWTKMSNYFSDDRSRHRDPTDVKLFSDDGKYTETAIENIGKTLDKIRTQKGWTNAQMLDHLDSGIYPSETTISRIINNDRKRPPSAAQLIELRRVFGVDLNKLADGENPLVLEELSDLCLTDLLHQIAEELLRRSGKKDCQNSVEPPLKRV